MNNSVVAFLDVLGFRDFVERTATIPQQANELIEALLALKRVPSQGREAARCSGFTAFSDSVVLSNPLPEKNPVKFTEPSVQVTATIDVIEASAEVAITLLERGLLCRGGIAMGPLHHQDEVLVGAGLIKAYDLETRVAVYPRIVVDDDVVSLLKTWSHSDFGGAVVPNKEPWVTLKRDNDGVWFIDLFKKMVFEDSATFPDKVAAAHDLIRRRLGDPKTAANLRIRAKYLWYASQINDLLSHPSFWGVYNLERIEA